FEREVLRLFSELIRFKLAHAEQNRLQEQSRLESRHSVESQSLSVQDTIQAQILGVQSAVEAQAAELAEMRQRISSLLERHVVLLRLRRGGARVRRRRALVHEQLRQRSRSCSAFRHKRRETLSPVWRQ